MPIPAIPQIMPMPIAGNGDRRDIPEQTPVGSNQLSFQSGFPSITSTPLAAGGVPPQREDFNAAYNLLSQHVFFQQSGGVYPWQGAGNGFAGLNYLAGAHVLGSDGKEYVALKASGPDVTGDGGMVGPKNPVADGGTYWGAARADKTERYELCEFYYFRHPTLKPGFQTAQGGLLANAATLYPEAWAYLQTAEGQKLCKTEAQWQALTTATWATLADGTKVGWNGIGGAPFYAPNTATGALRLPDLRGMYAEAAGFDSLGVGAVHGDGIREIIGQVASAGAYAFHPDGASGAFAPAGLSGPTPTPQSGSGGRGSLRMTASRVVPVANKTQTRAYGALACVYLGLPR